MAKDAFTLSDVREPTLTIVCESCGRRWRYNVDRLIAKHGNAKILYLLAELTAAQRRNQPIRVIQKYADLCRHGRACPGHPRSVSDICEPSPIYITLSSA
jgi:hypothetical protein